MSANDERKEFVMSDEQLAALLEACKPVPYMVFNGVQPLSPQENANAAWRRLGDEMGFDWATVRAVSGGDQHRFTAVPTSPSVSDFDPDNAT